MKIDAFFDFKLRLAAIDRILPPASQHATRNEVVLIMQLQYKLEVPVSDTQINIRLTQEEEGALEAVA